MKTKANSIRVMTAMLALLSMVIVFSVAAAPAMADTVFDRIGYGKEARTRLMDAAQVRDLLPVLEVVVPEAEEAAEDEDYVVEPEPETIPDGGGEEMVEPDEGPFPDGGGDEMVEPNEAAPGDDGDEAEEPAEVIPGDAGGDEMVPEEAGDDSADETVQPDESATDEAADEADTPEEAQEQSDEASTLPFTGGDNTPWFIAGVAIALAGAALLLRRRDNTDRR